MTVAEPTKEPTRHAAPADDGDDVIHSDLVQGDNAPAEDSYTRYTLAAFISPGALAIAAFTLASSGLLVLLGPLALIPSFGLQTPIESAKNLAYLGIGIGIVAIALALWSLLRPESGPLWPRMLAGAAGLVALMVIFQYTVVLVMAANAPADALIQ